MHYAVHTHTHTYTHTLTHAYTHISGTPQSKETAKQTPSTPLDPLSAAAAVRDPLSAALSDPLSSSNSSKLQVQICV